MTEAEIKWSPPPPLIGSPFAKSVIPYSILFICGTIGNTAVLSYVFFITRSLKSSVTALGNTFIYMVALCLVDLLVTTSIPFSLSSMILDNWVFGEIGCKFHWAMEMSNKMLSTFILTALAFDRYMAVCHPGNKKIHDIKVTVIITSCLALLSIMLILPVVFSARIKQFDNYGEYTSRMKVHYKVRRNMCTDGMRQEFRLLASTFLIFFSFLLPCTLITFFYGRIILTLRKRQRTMMKTKIPLRRINIYTMGATSFYLVCQVPFWIPQIYIILSTFIHLEKTQSMMTYTYYSHLLPFVATSFNWIFYARLNSQFKKGLVLVTERMIRKRTNQFRTAQSSQCRDEEHCFDVIFKSDDSQNQLTCPKCQATLYPKEERKMTGVDVTYHTGSYAL